MMMSNDALFREIIDELLEIYRAKNHGYGNVFSDLFDEFGLPYATGHIYEKASRRKMLTNKDNKVKKENIEGTLFDMARYGVMSIIELIEREAKEQIEAKEVLDQVETKKTIYLAAPLFSEAEQMFNQCLADDLRRIGYQVYNPQEADDINDKSSYADSVMIAQYDTKELLRSDILVAVLDGQTIDPGVAAEVGIAYYADMPIYGIYTDPRQRGYDNQAKLQALSEVAECQFSYVNLFVVGLIKQQGDVYNSSNELVHSLTIGG